jgi:hypothetical protein
MNRREFIQVSALSMLPDAGKIAAWCPPAGEVYSLFDRPMRWAQLAFVENDPGQYDPAFWLDYFARTHSQGACLSAGGVVAFYPTKIPLHYRSAWMKDTDPFGEMVAGCRKLGMVILARTDPHAIRRATYEAHPDWVAVDEQGEKRRHWANPDLWVTCALGPYNFDFMTEVHREIMSLYRVDGIFINRWAGHGTCYCEHCRRNFKEASGLEVPQGPDADPTAQRKYILWRRARLTELWRLWDGEIRKINPASRCVPNGPPQLKSTGELADIMFQDRQARSGQTCPWANGKHGKELRAVMGRKPIGGICSVGLEEQYRWKDSVQSEAEIRIWVAEAIANGLRPWFTKFNAKPIDRRWLKVVEDIYGWHHASERYLRNECPIARVALVYSEQSRDFYDQGKQHQSVEDHARGAYHALIEARVPFEMVHDGMLDQADLDRFRLLILPNIAALSDAQCGQLEAFVRRGGSLLATFETSLYDEWGQRRDDFGMAGLFGVSFKGRLEGPMRNSYLSIRRDVEGGYHPVVTGLEEAVRIVNGVYRLEVEPRQPFPSPVTLVPSYPDLPMEDVFPRSPETAIRELYLREFGPGRVAYFPWDITRTFWQILAVDHGRLFANVVDWATNEPRPVVVTGPGVIDIAVWRQKDSMTVHLVNLTNPMLMKGPFRELIPIGPQQVELQIPPGASVRKVALLKAGTESEARLSNGVLRLTVPRILDHEVVAVDLGKQ